MHATLPLLKETDFPAIRRGQLTTLQVNLGYRCNQSCLHCHVNAGPNRKEMMSADTIETVIEFLRAGNIETLDLTGGAPELNPHFRDLVRRARALGVHVMDRCNLTILGEQGQEELAGFLAGNRVEVIASLPCYLEENVDGQRGRGVYQGSIDGLRKLNALGYGKPGSGLALNLVYNPTGPYLPPPQASLEADYKRELASRFGIVFNQLFTLTNLPIQRFGSMLISKGQFDDYMQLLREAYSPGNLDAVMCRSLLSVDWQGYVYDCDFNQMLDLPLAIKGKRRPKLADLIGRDLDGNPVMIADHCYGCTAGQGSSCGGALSQVDSK
ncbi:MAG: arsenosugar biosynthesis radical SAM protein ArsS [Sedimenticolaceae bacterium]|nr:arsenosugar biosynthesis radical SAM protein ArsS [Sedimenticolaceae bacterium]